MNTKKTIYVGLSGGVDSSVTALRLKQQGYNVVGVFIKTWQPDFLICNWEKERLDAMRVAAHLDIPFKTFDAVDAYKNEVADYMICEYKDGRTPNPDVMCNQYVKFGVFLDFALKEGADAIATGHYAQIQKRNDEYILMRGKDTSKDQSYFLWTLNQEQLEHTLFPVGNTSKYDIRKEAERAGLKTFKKADSQGICFLGQVNIKEFLSHYIKTSEGYILNEAGIVVGKHDGALFYTTGQRHGFKIKTYRNKSTAHYVIARDLDKNTITVSEKAPVSENLKLSLSNINIITDWKSKNLNAQIRYRQKPFGVEINEVTDDGRAMLNVLEGIDTPSLGQSCVIYTGDECLGGGIISL